MPKAVFGKGYPFLRPDALLSYEQICRLVKLFSKLGVSKIRLTGGEPLLRKDLEKLISGISSIDNIDDIALTTNASLLTAQRANTLRQAGVRRLNISLDALSADIYQTINPIPVPLEDILLGIENAMAAEFDVVKVNMVVQKGVNHSDILPMVNHFKGSGVILRFIEFMDVGNYNNWNLDKVFTAAEIIQTIRTEHALEAVDRNYKAEVARRWHFQDGSGEIGVISSITQPFCGDCARARLSARGELFSCLFAANGYDLKSDIESGDSDEALIQRLGKIWSNREDQYSMRRKQGDSVIPETGNLQKVEMSYIGG